LWDDSGYYLSNGVALCGSCHIKAEQTVLSCDELRLAAGIEEIVLPPHLYSDSEWDKWGNMILPNGTRLRGELFYDESVQKVLSVVLHLFSKYVKYPRTYHLPWSPGTTNDDRMLEDTKQFEGQEVVVSVKMDGENSTFYRDYYHARSLSADSHPSKHWVKNFHSQVGYNIPEGYRVCGENLFAKHTIFYKGLKSYFYMFSIWNDINECLSWDDTLEWADLLDLKVVPVLYRDIYDEELIKSLYKPTYEGNDCEGYVVLLAKGSDIVENKSQEIYKKL